MPPRRNVMTDGDAAVARMPRSAHDICRKMFASHASVDVVTMPFYAEDYSRCSRQQHRGGYDAPHALIDAGNRC